MPRPLPCAGAGNSFASEPTTIPVKSGLQFNSGGEDLGEGTMVRVGVAGGPDRCRVLVLVWHQKTRCAAVSDLHARERPIDCQRIRDRNTGAGGVGAGGLPSIRPAQGSAGGFQQPGH